jgi:opacity protein-like surface antigen
MVRSTVGAAVAAALALACGLAAVRAEDLGTEIDLAAFRETTGGQPSVWEGVPIEEVSRRFGSAPRRFYLSGMIGPSFASVANPDDPTFASSDTLFNAGGALGMAFERRRGQLRAEVEGMGRSSYDAQMFASPSPDDFTLLTNNWSVMTNLWRDVMLTDRFGGYGGGGIGAGGYMLGERLDGVTEYANPDSNFAWQFGGGLLWDLTDRLTFDVGYRYFHIDTIRQAGVEPNQFAASELMFTLRLYEPFRTWRR